MSASVAPEPPTVLHGLDRQVSPPDAGILSRTVHDADGLRLVLFGIAPGEELSEHTSARGALVQVLSGHLTLTLEGVAHEVGPGDWVRMAPGLRHAVRADEPAVMLLTLLAPVREPRHARA